MIYSYVVYQSLIDLCRADKRGLLLSEDEFNRLAKIVNQRIFSKKYAEFETTTDNIGGLAPFKVINSAIALVAAECSLPANCYNLIGKPRVYDSNNVLRRCDLVSQLELEERYDDYLTQPTEVYPVYLLGEVDASDNTVLHVYPPTITGNIYIDYLRNPTDPFLDYYVSETTFERTYLAENITYNIPSGCKYRDGSTGGALVNKLSQTVDWEFSDDDLPLILSIFSQMTGIALPDQLLIEAGNLEEDKNA